MTVNYFLWRALLRKLKPVCGHNGPVHKGVDGKSYFYKEGGDGGFNVSEDELEVCQRYRGGSDYSDSDSSYPERSAWLEGDGCYEGDTHLTKSLDEVQMYEINYSGDSIISEESSASTVRRHLISEQRDPVYCQAKNLVYRPTCDAKEYGSKRSKKPGWFNHAKDKPQLPPTESPKVGNWKPNKKTLNSRNVTKCEKVESPRSYWGIGGSWESDLMHYPSDISLTTSAIYCTSDISLSTAPIHCLSDKSLPSLTSSNLDSSTSKTKCALSQKCQTVWLNSLLFNVISFIFPADVFYNVNHFLEKHYDEFCAKCFGHSFFIVFVICLILYELPMKIPIRPY